jgi:hypothetical protein
MPQSRTGPHLPPSQPPGAIAPRRPQIVVQLSRKNEQLVLRSAKVSEEEMAAVQAEFQARIAALEKKVRRGRRPCGTGLCGALALGVVAPAPASGGASRPLSRTRKRRALSTRRPSAWCPILHVCLPSLHTHLYMRPHFVIRSSGEHAD